VDLDAIIFNPTPSIILKWLRFKAVSWGHDFEPCTPMVWDCLTAGLLCLHHIQSLANVTMATIACNDICRESRQISSSQNFLFMQKFTHICFPSSVV
jgi:hypothetical protein